MKNINILLKAFLLIGIYFLFANMSFSQNPNPYCGTEQLPHYLQKDYPNVSTTEALDEQYIVRLYVHIINDDDGNGGVSISSLYQELNRLEAYFADHDICFMLSGKEYIDDSYYANFNYDDQNDDGFSTVDNELVVDYPPLNRSISIYILPDYTVFRGLSRGEYICITSDRFNTCHLAHEIGHSLGLPHTHQGSGSELVDGSNCTTAGDRFCDTPADPKLNGSNTSSATCTYTDNTTTDANGDLYQPDLTNIMSYAPFSCRGVFTPEQVQKMRNKIQNYWAPIGYTVTIQSWNIPAMSFQSEYRNFLAKNDLILSNAEVSGSAKVNLVARDYILIKGDSHIDPGNNGYFEARADFFCNGIYPQVNLLENPSNAIIEQNAIIPKLDKDFHLTVFPNPASPMATVNYQIIFGGVASLGIYNIQGKELKTLIRREYQEAGTYQIEFDGSQLPPGLYFCRLMTDSGTETIKLIIE